MDEFTKIILSGILIMQLVQLVLLIAYSWNKKNQQDKSTTMTVIRFSILILSTIVIYALKFIWSY